MEGDALHQPNDKLSTATFGVPENAAAFLQAKPPPILPVVLSQAAEPGASGVSFAVRDDDLILAVPPELLQIVLRDILGAEVDRTGFENRVSRIADRKIRDQAMTLAQVYRQEGRQEGLCEGLRKRIGDALETRFGKVPESIVEALSRIGDAEALRAVLKRSIQSGSLDEFSGSLPPR